MAKFTSYYGRYVLGALENNALVLRYLLRNVPLDSPKWDERPVPDRFTLREIVAHLLDFDMVNRERFERMIREESPDLPNWDEEEAARHYVHRHPGHDLEHLLESRRSLAVWLEGLCDHKWKRTGTRPGAGTFNIKEGVAFILGHDAYHLKQVSDWLTLLKKEAATK